MQISRKRTITLILLAIIGVVYLQYVDFNQQKELIRLYNQKNDSTFLYLLQENNPNTELAKSLENLSVVDKNNRRAFIEAMVNARNAGEAWQNQLMHLTQLCDKPGVKLNEQNALGWGKFLFQNSTKEQQELETDIFRANISGELYTMNVRYNKIGPQSFGFREIEIIKGFTREVKILENKYSEVQSSSTPMFIESQNQLYMARLKQQYINSLRPSVTNISLICNSYLKQLNK